MNHHNLEALEILIIDDNVRMHSIIKPILNAMWIKKIRFCDNAAVAFADLRHFLPDVIITDWAMQPLDGLGFTRLVRRDADSPNPYIPIILLTGHTDIRRVIEARDAGVNEFLAKPVSFKTLHTRIVSIVENPRPFIRTKTYVGPCRRRGQNPNYNGPERRKQARGNHEHKE